MRYQRFFNIVIAVIVFTLAGSTVYLAREVERLQGLIARSVQVDHDSWDTQIEMDERFEARIAALEVVE